MTSRERLPAMEAARLLVVTADHVRHLAVHGVLEGALVDGAWFLDEASVRAYAVRRRPGGRRPARRLPAGPLLEQVRRRGGPAACGASTRSAEARALARAARSGSLTERAADELAVRLLGLLPAELWGESMAS